MAETKFRAETYQELLEEHAKLRGLLQDLERIFTERSEPLSDVLRRLVQLQDLVDLHFAAEEESDCFPDLISHAPRVCDRVKVMLAEHGELRSEIHQLVQQGKKRGEDAANWDRWADGFRAFAAKLMTHEQTENELVQEVFTEDIGSKD
ncbi:MAG: hemerythrin domain-containing protein [Pirellulaceae bacterium]